MTTTGQDIGFDEDDPYIAGDSLEIEFTTAGLDLTDADITWVLKAASLTGVFAGAALLTKTVGSGVAIEDPGPPGVAVVTILPEDTAALSGYFYHEIEATLTGGTVHTLATGRMKITGGAIA